MQFFSRLQEATFLSRPNRFTVTCLCNGRRTMAFLPNPGRLWELLLPGTSLYLEENRAPGRNFRFTVVAAKRDGDPIVLHTHRTNEVARRLIQQGLVPGLEQARVERSEVTLKRSRFDFLLRETGREILLEVKSCTLFSRQAALFPDAVTSRGRRHVEELAELSGSGRACAVLFLIHSARPEFFLPEYHVDLEFAKALLASKDKVSLYPVSVRWREDLSLDPDSIRRLPIPWKIVEKEARDGGAYVLVMKLDRMRILQVGALGKIRFPKGYYLYVGSASQHLSKRIERHKRLRKKPFWHVDYLREVSVVHAVFPIRTSDDLECCMALDLMPLSEWTVPGFGSSDCSCPSHLYAFSQDPLSLPSLHRMLLHYKADRLLEGNESHGWGTGQAETL